MATTKFQGFPTYRYAQIALKGGNRGSQAFADVQNNLNQVVEEREPVSSPTEMSPHKAMNQKYGTEREDDSTVKKENELEVNYENNVTALYEAISNSQWDIALETLQSSPQEARTWVVRYKEDSTKGIMWRFLPLHSACARQPPNAVISSLLQAYPEGAGSCDDQGMVSFQMVVVFILFYLFNTQPRN